jgi:hypothetical protein
MAVDALQLGKDAGAVVLVSRSPALAPLVRALDAGRIRVQSASFEAHGPWPVQRHHQLDKSCLFIP